MNAVCAIHPDRLAVAACTTCRRPICAACAVMNVAGQPVCTVCAQTAAPQQGTSAQQTPPYPNAPLPSQTTYPTPPGAAPGLPPPRTSGIPMNVPRSASPVSTMPTGSMLSGQAPPPQRRSLNDYVESATVAMPLSQPGSLADYSAPPAGRSPFGTGGPSSQSRLPDHPVQNTYAPPPAPIQDTENGPSITRLLAGFAMGVLAAVLGCGLWMGITLGSGYIIGPLALGIGAMIGKAVLMGAGEPGVVQGGMGGVLGMGSMLLCFYILSGGQLLHMPPVCGISILLGTVWGYRIASG